MTGILVSWILSALAIILTANFVPGFQVVNFTTALIVAFVLGIINAFVKPILMILTLPINMMTFGLFTFVINAVLILLAARLVNGFTVEGFLPALLAAVILWLVNTVIHFAIFPVKAS